LLGGGLVVGHLYLVLSAAVVGLAFVEVRVLADAEKVAYTAYSYDGCV